MGKFKFLVSNTAQYTREEVKVQVGWRGVGVISERGDLQDGSERRPMFGLETLHRQQEEAELEVKCLL